ncbi:immunoglobulin-like domain-containing protein [Pseudalkalibacillus salsuginis]|uniref:immunoglobulin-like domain-containing protein n=1 Tax=Pseudalkalibacillus salsuginis TaxID=2910972 RepID=UPI001F387F45|nr:immunoglobulin-like domain-containing protein [Pseudalkalibacillus salsuginis]MCF6411537.1 Ig-like domain-containing protein [Pseudalkalibacillus salsuginis]
MLDNRKEFFTFITVVAMVLAVFFVIGPSKSSAAINAEKILDYEMNEAEGTLINDSIGHFDGTLVNPDDAQLISTDNAGVVKFGGNNAHITIPEGVLDGKDSLTVSALINWSGKNRAEWLYTFGQNDRKYIYFTPSYPSDGTARFGISTDGWRNEVSAKTSTLSRNEWKLVTTVISGGTLELYVDGELSSSGSTNFTLEDVKNTDGISGYLGKSFYGADPNFNGMIADFEVYDGALTAEEIKELTVAADEEIEKMETLLLDSAAAQLDYDDFLNGNASKEEVKTDLSFPKNGANGTMITWESSNKDVIGNDGSVTRPPYEEGNQEVVLKATISDGTNSLTKEFTVTVIHNPEDSVAVNFAAEELTVYNINDVRGNITLPTEGEYNTTISWTSEDESIITPTGEVNRPAHGEGDVTVKLKATIMLNDQTLTKAFLAHVKEMPKKEDYQGYLFSYFTGEGYANGEQIYFGLSEGNDPLHWQQLNNGEPVFTSGLGEEGLRDPFIIRSPEGDKFYMIATDLKMYGSGDWGRAQTNGSRSIMVWESSDLINWSEQRMVEVAPLEAGNTWAPEIFYDEKIGEYVIFWASKLYENEDDRSTGNSYQRMMYTTTRDFHTFSEPKVYMDYGYSIIDTTMIEHDGKIYRFTKDERGNTSSTPNGKFIFQEVGDSVLDPDFELIREGIGKGDISRGEGPLVFKSNTEEKWYMFIDEFGGRGYVPFETTDLDSGEWTIPEDYDLPNRPRHGTVLPVTQAEYDALLENVPVEVEAPVSENPVTGVTLDQEAVELTEGEVIHLAATVVPAEADNHNVLWSSNNEEVAVVDENGTVTALQEGRAVITVTTVEGGYIDTVKVTVIPEPSIADLQELTEQYVESGEVTGPLVPKLTNSLEQIIHHLKKGHEAQAMKHLENYLEHLEKAKAVHLSEVAKAALSEQVNLSQNNGLN